jgi:hypothetical protein
MSNEEKVDWLVFQIYMRVCNREKKIALGIVFRFGLGLVRRISMVVVEGNRIWEKDFFEKIYFRGLFENRALQKIMSKKIFNRKRRSLIKFSQ